MDWLTPKLYRVGDRVDWGGVVLVCTREHYAGEYATHPWDPGDGWDARKAATLWAPNGPREAEHLSLDIIDSEGINLERLRDVLMEVVGSG